MHAVVAGHFGVERDAKQVALTNRNDSSILQRRENLGRARVRDDWRSDEGSMNRVLDTADMEVHLKGIELVTESISLNAHVEPAEGLLTFYAVLDAIRKHDEPGTGTKHRQPVCNGCLDWVE